MPEVVSSLGQYRDLPPVRVGNTMRPLTLTMRLRAGTVQTAGGDVIASLFLRATDAHPITDVRPLVTKLASDPLGQPRFRIDLSKEQVLRLAELATTSQTQGQSSSRTLSWSCSFQAANGATWPLLYGKLTIVMGASSG